MYVFDGILLVSRHDVGKTIVSCKKDIKWRNQEGEHQHRSAINKKIRNKRGSERERDLSCIQFMKQTKHATV